VGEGQSTPFALEFNRSIQVETRGERLTADAGGLLLREVFSRLELEEFFARNLLDPRQPALITHPQIELLRTHLLLLAQGWQDADDATALRHDPAFRLGVSERRGTAPLTPPPEQSNQPDGLASQPTLSRLVGTLSFGAQRQVLRQGLMQAAARRLQTTRGHRLRYATLDIDSLPVEVYGTQAGSRYNGHYGVRCYHPLVAVVAETGDLLDVRLREGNVHTADGALEFVLPLLDRMEKDLCQVASVRMDAGFPQQALLAGLEQREVGYVARLRKNPRLEKLAAAFVQVGEPGEDTPRESFQELSYQADTWSQPRRVVAVLQQEPEELFPRCFFLLTNWDAQQMPAAALLALYRQRGTAEGHLGELMSVLEPCLSSTRRPKSHYRGQPPKRRYTSADPFAANEVRLLLNALAYALVHAVRTLMEKVTGEGWALRRVLDRVLKVPARILRHSRRIVVVLPPAAATLWAKLWQLLHSWRWVPPLRPV
jgi:Transposase DDE domain group 1